ncbi:efflux transporter outer membrane subunit [uncultured Cedecea sp.]|uniref:efflux transporter outer membrane subunit n=1 Tax=uncultured Cedecea sp. TaxID=988762 RepID=UPI0026077569|nr:efflux transporter outer membrane subunit [uncultured Cedecea sp.]
MTIRLSIKPFYSRIFSILKVISITFMLAGCMVGPDYVQSPNDLAGIVLKPEKYDKNSFKFSDLPYPKYWWSLFDDPILNALQLQALQNNLDLQITAERIEQSRAQLGITSSQQLPKIGNFNNYSREALSEYGKLVALGAPSSAGNLWQTGFDANWELDLWGRVGRMKEMANATLESTVYDHELSKVALSAEVGKTYLLLRSNQAQIKIAKQSILIAQEILTLVNSRKKNGTTTTFEVSSAKAQLAKENAAVTGLLHKQNNLLNALTFLLGEKPKALDQELSIVLPFPSMPSNIPVGVSSEIAHNRPDILQAEAQLHAATASIGIAKADFYPRVTLNGKIGFESLESGQLDSWDARFFSIGPTIYLPIFQGGALRQRLALSESKQRTAALIYRKTVLQAWHEINNAFDALAEQQSQYADLSIVYAENQQSLRAYERNYQQGTTDYLTVLTAERNLLVNQRDLDNSTTAIALGIVDLYKSLGGGWNPNEISTMRTIDTRLESK